MLFPRLVGFWPSAVVRYRIEVGSRRDRSFGMTLPIFIPCIIVNYCGRFAL
jgi:hypothetical protein